MSICILFIFRNILSSHFTEGDSSILFDDLIQIDSKYFKSNIESLKRSEKKSWIWKVSKFWRKNSLFLFELRSNFFDFHTNGYKIDNQIYRSNRMESLEKDIRNDIWPHSDRFGSYSWLKISNNDFLKFWRAKNFLLLKENLGTTFF